MRALLKSIKIQGGYTMRNKLFINEKILKEDYEYFLSRQKKSNIILLKITSFTGIDIDANIKMLFEMVKWHII